MNRVIRFRGRKHYPYTDVWYYGSLWQNSKGEAFIRTDKGNSFEVDPETVGQFTGLLDSKGNEIYEGDVLQKEDVKWIVVWDAQYPCFKIVRPESTFGYCWYVLDYLFRSDATIIGNIHDNPKLKKE